MGKSRSKSKGSKSKKAKKSAKVTWSTEEIGILQSYEEKWFALSSQEEKQKLAYSCIANELRNLSPEKYGIEVILQRRELQAEWDKKCGQIKSWYKRKAPAAKERRIFRFERRIALRQVVGQVKSVAIKEAVMKKLPEDKKKDRQAYFSLYQATLTEFMEALSKREKKKFEDVREEWQAEGPPEAVQIKNAQRYGYRCIEEMHKVANKQFGMLLITFSARRTKTGGWEYFSHDYNPSLNSAGESVLPITSWAKAECRVFGKQFAKWVTYTDEAQAGQVNAEDGQSTGTRQGSVFKLQTTASGLPLLPQPILSSSGEEYYGTKREILRDFFVSHYRLATGKAGARVPWLAMSQNVEKFISQDYIPATVALNDPGRMEKSHISLLLEHLRERQETDGIPTFLFHHQKRHDDTLSTVDYPAEVLVDNKKAYEGKTLPDNQSAQVNEGETFLDKSEVSDSRQNETSVLSEKTARQKGKGKEKESVSSDLPPSSASGSISLADRDQAVQESDISARFSDNTGTSSTVIQPTSENARYAAGTTLRIDGDNFDMENNENSTMNNLDIGDSSPQQNSSKVCATVPDARYAAGSTSQTDSHPNSTISHAATTNIGPGDSIPNPVFANHPQDALADAQNGKKAVRFQEPMNLPYSYGNYLGPGPSTQQFHPGMHVGNSPHQQELWRNGNFGPPNFPYFPGFYHPFAGFHPQIAPNFGPNLIQNQPRPSFDHMGVSAQSMSDSPSCDNDRSSHPVGNNMSSTHAPRHTKRKRSDSAAEKDLETQPELKTPRKTRSQTGALGSAKKKNQPFSSGPRRKLNERWDWQTDQMDLERAVDQN